MKILIGSLQPSRLGSRGPLHCALELALELRSRGHEALVVPQPARLSRADLELLERVGVPQLPPPDTAQGILKSPEELSRLSASRDTLHQAYQAYLVDPLPHQFPGLLQLLEEHQPALVVSDTRAYGLSLAARARGVPEAAFCSGLHLVAPDRLLSSDREVAQRLRPRLQAFLGEHRLSAEFRHLDLLSPRVQVVFATEALLGGLMELPPRTSLVGPLAPSPRGGTEVAPEGPYVVLSFGSVLDPGDFPKVTRAAIEAAALRGMSLVVGSRKMAAEPSSWPPHVKVAAYLDLPATMRGARALIHHGGPLCLAEALAQGVPQLVIPQGPDQSFQAELLQRCQAGLTLEPEQVSRDSLGQALDALLDPEHPIHRGRTLLAQEYGAGSGARRAVDVLESVALRAGEPQNAD